MEIDAYVRGGECSLKAVSMPHDPCRVGSGNYYLIGGGAGTWREDRSKDHIHRTQWCRVIFSPCEETLCPSWLRNKRVPFITRRRNKAVSHTRAPETHTHNCDLSLGPFQPAMFMVHLESTTSSQAVLIMPGST